MRSPFWFGVFSFQAIVSLVGAEFRKPASESELRYWLNNMVAYHRFTTAEASLATGLSERSIDQKLQEFAIAPGRWEPTSSNLVMLPYPGGRHPRIGFLDGAVDPQRETKISVFAPWDRTSYVVLDVPEAIWCQKGLLYLAHTHVPTLWTRESVQLPQLEWNRARDGELSTERLLPNGVAFGASARTGLDGIRMELWLRNGSKESLSDLRVQNCVMLKGAPGFTSQTNANKVIVSPFVACRSESGDRWLISAWTPCHRPWANAPVPCLHSDPKFPDCSPGETKRLRGWFSFFQGKDVQAEFERLKKLDWFAAAE